MRLSNMLFPAFLTLSLLSCVHAHGIMCTPRQRGAYHSSKCGSNLPFPPNPVTDYCAHCLNGGTVVEVKKNLPPGGWKEYDPINDFDGTATRAGLCGDAVGNNDHMRGGSFLPYKEIPIVSKWQAGDVVNFEVEIDTNHNGYFEFFLCNLDTCGTKDIERKCFVEGHCKRLERVAKEECQKPSQKTYTKCGPIDKQNRGRWYVPCRKTGHVGEHLVGGKSGTMRYKLPEDMHCEHCVVQWYWATANSCAPKDFLKYFETYNNPFGTTCESDGGGRGAYREGMSECEEDSVPEEFWSCSDVSISAKGSKTGPKPSAKPSVAKATPSASPKPKSSLKPSPSPMVGDNSKPNEKPSEKKCLSEGEECKTTSACCGHDSVCVMGYPRERFVCRFWWSLWKDVEEKAKED